MRRQGVLLVFLGPLLGCAHAAETPLPPPVEALRAQLGAVGIVAAGPGAPAEFKVPLRGKGAAAAAGVGTGFLVGLGGAALCFVSYGRVPEACVIGLATPYLMVEGGRQGAARGIEAEEVDRAEATLRGTLDAFRFSEALRDEVVRLSREEHGLAFFPLPHPERPSGGDAAMAAGPGLQVGAVLETTVTGLRLTATSGPGQRQGLAAGINPPLELAVEVRVRLLRAADGHEVDARGFAHRRGGYAFTAWAAQDGQRLREELQATSQALARQIVEELFWAAIALRKDAERIVP